MVRTSTPVEKNLLNISTSFVHRNKIAWYSLRGLRSRARHFRGTDVNFVRYAAAFMAISNQL